MKWVFKIRLFCLDIGRYRFSPGLIMTLLTIALAYVMFSLGQWQLSRAQYKDNLQQKIAERQNMSAISYKHLPHEESERVFLPVRMVGYYDYKHSFLLDNRIVDGVVGYEVFTPFAMANDISIVINRGFIPLGKSRQVLPEFGTPKNKVVINGLMEKAPSKGLILSDNLHQSNQWPAVMQYIDIGELETKLNTRLMNMVVRLAENEPGGLKYHQPVVNLNSAKNNGYAFQWFAMMAAVLILYFVVNTKKRIH
ncbi:MAG: SURF1 family protein [Gammaproteobacteria bacterium]|nr:MAG: SURF1 family protein [Gammaproteobacteria bacterium]